MKIDTCWINGNIQTGNEDLEYVEAIACANGKIVATGKTQEILAFIDQDAKIIDLGSKTVVPGFIDSHLHLTMFGESLERVRIRDKSKEEILELIKMEAKKTKVGEWIVGGMGWNNEVWVDPDYPSKEDLDDVAPNNPVILPRMDGHMIWVNSVAFELAGITNESNNPAGGELLRKTDGTLLGCVSNSACDLIRKAIPAITSDKREKFIIRAQNELLSLGVTSVSDMHTAVDDYNLIRSMYEEGILKIRFYGTIEGAKLDKDPELKDIYKICPIINDYNERFTIRAVKILGDGSVGAQSAAQKYDYEDRPGYSGNLFFSDEKLYEIVNDAAKKNMQVITHAIGDKTIDQVIKIYKQVINEHNLSDHRFRIEHFQLVSGDSLEQAKKYSILASMQPMHAPNSASMALRRLGYERAKSAYAVGLVYRGLGKIALGSDAPVSYPNPIEGIYAAVTRKNTKREPKDGFFIENSMKIEEAFKGYTLWAAQAQFADKEKGSLEVGKNADFIVLSDNLLTKISEEILDVKVDMTVIADEVVYIRK